MATINIQYSQAVVDTIQKTLASATPLNSSMGTLVDALASAAYEIGADYQSFSSWSLEGTTLRLVFPDGATETFTGIVMDNPGAERGSATATGFQFHKEGYFSISDTGILRYDYTLKAAGSGYALSLIPAARGSTITSLKLATDLSTSDPDYPADVGNVAILLNGEITAFPSGAISGTINRITATADKILLSSVIEGSFNVLVNTVTTGQGLANSSVSGTLTAIKDTYHDGSYAHVAGVASAIGTNQAFDATLYSDATRLGGDDQIVIDLPSRLYSDFQIASGDGNDRISLKGGGGALNLAAGNGNDTITLLGASHRVDGGNGIDVVTLPSARADYTVQRTDTGFSLQDKAGASSALSNVERIAFADSTIALDISGSGGQAYRLYQAAFNRTPDAAGLGYWIDAMDKGASINAAAAGFVGSPEFVKAYGSNPGSLELVTKFYENILHRTPEADGLKYWKDLLDTKAASVAVVLAGISESGENQAGLIGMIGNGFAYTPYG